MGKEGHGIDPKWPTIIFKKLICNNKKGIDPASLKTFKIYSVAQNMNIQEFNSLTSFLRAILRNNSHPENGNSHIIWDISTYFLLGKIISKITKMCHTLFSSVHYNAVGI